MTEVIALGDLTMIGTFACALLLSFAAVEAGYRLARRRHRLAQLEEEAPVGAMVGATLGLLAFVLGLTFSQAMDAFHARKLALVDEVNAIQSTYLLADLAPPPQRAEIRELLRAYANERLQWTAGDSIPATDSASALLGRLWVQVAAVGRAEPGNVDTLIGAATQLFELRQQRILVRERSRIPAFFWAVLTLLSGLTLAAMGYHAGVAGTRRSPVTVAVTVGYAVLIMLIVDLDQPGRGFVNVSQQPMVDLRDRLNADRP